MSNPCTWAVSESPCAAKPATSEQLEDLAMLLERIFYQTVESLADSRWELRRMSQQVVYATIKSFIVACLKQLSKAIESKFSCKRNYKYE